MGLRKLFSALRLDEIRCASCGVPFALRTAVPKLCPDCRKAIPDAPCACPKCGLALPGTQAALCGECLNDPPPWEAFRMLGFYENLLRELLLRAKFGGEAAVLAVLGELLALRCGDLTPPQAVLPMPLHTQRLRERGFNQCQELARPLASGFGAPLRPDLLIRRESGHSQRGLSRAGRLENLKHAFLAPASAAGLRILLIDDIMTTGATARFAARALVKAGAARVDLAVVARAQA